LRNAFVVQKIIPCESIAYPTGEDARLNFPAVEGYDDSACGLITREGKRNQELINAW
jgi:hypothetical protein